MIADKNDWSDLFFQLAKKTSDKHVLIVLDEITWMAMQDPNFLGKLKNAWDMYFQRNDHVVLALCGSVSAWISLKDLEWYIRCH
ncbi:MAG: hypothetical protein DHS20C10_09910 [marine bacterium B5-7]|nr:MAG: hypothetical protein DHS20C10_09910 [marine bacterium B5-7]